MDEPWQLVHPDTLVGPELDAVVAMFRDVDWQDQSAVEQRVAALRALACDPQDDNLEIAS